MLALSKWEKMKVERGFTLLEILAALAIAVVGIAAVVNTTTTAVEILQSTENRILSSWVASNRLAELRLSREWPSAITRDLSAELGGRVWYYREKISTTADPDLLRIDLSVYTDKDQEQLSMEMFGYLGRYSEPVSTPTSAGQQGQGQGAPQNQEALGEQTQQPNQGNPEQVQDGDQAGEG